MLTVLGLAVPSRFGKFNGVHEAGHTCFANSLADWSVMGLFFSYLYKSARFRLGF